MAWKCDGCGATNQDSNEVCEYCGRHKIVKTSSTKIHSTQDKNEGKSISSSNDIMNRLDTALNPTQNYKSSEKSIKPNFEDNGGLSTEKIIVGIVVFFIIIWLLF